MRLDFIWKVAYKEILSTWRDRRTLRSTILMPLLFIPIFTLGLPLLFSRALEGQQEVKQKVGVVGTVPAELRSLLTRDQTGPGGQVTRAGLALVPVADAERAVRDGEVDAAIVLPEAVTEVGATATVPVRVVSKLSNQAVQAGAASKVRDALRTYNAQLVSGRLQQLQLDESFINPVRIEEVDASSREEKSSGALAFIIPFLLLQFIMNGAQAPAVDATAGEKERGTLEALLVSPVRRVEVLLGKLVATMMFALVTALFGVIGFAVASGVSRLLFGDVGQRGEAAAALGGSISLDPAGLGVILVVAVSGAFALSAAFIAIAVYARSYREEQTYLAPIALLLLIPMLVLQFADFIDKALWLYAIPLIGGAVAVLDVVKGSISTSGVLVAVLANLVAAVGLTLLGLRSFRNEAVLFRN